MITQDQKPVSTATASLDELKDHLNDLWTRYLMLLDEYDQAQRDLSSHISKGFFSLAQANFRSTTRTRFGQDYYDERMQASRNVTVSMSEDGKTTFGITNRMNTSTNAERSTKGSPTVDVNSETKGSGDEKDGTARDDATVTVEQQPSPPMTPIIQSKRDSRTDGSETEKGESEDVKPGQTANDPIRWFGVLVPPQLRSCQASFVSTIEGPICRATAASKGMRLVEVEIRRLRKDIRKMEKSAN